VQMYSTRLVLYFVDGLYLLPPYRIQDDWDGEVSGPERGPQGDVRDETDSDDQLHSIPMTIHSQCAWLRL
jgi:hypothetical protein